MTEHEKALLESILCESLIIDKYKIIPEMFCSSDARNLFDAFVVTIMKGVKLDTIAVSDSLRESKRDDLISVLCSLDPWTSTRAENCVRVLRDDLRRRELKPIVADAFNGLRDNAEIDVVVQKLSDGLVSAWRSAKEDEDQSIENNFKFYTEELERRYKDNGKSGLKFGIQDIDSRLGSNIGAGELVAIAARPGVGKTALAIQLSVHNAIAQQIPATIFSLEMTRNEIYDRIFAQRIVGGINLLRSGMIQSQRTRDDMMMLAKELSAAKFRTFDRPMTPQSVSAHIRREALVYNTRLFVVDYLGLLDFSDDRKKSRWENVGDATKTLKRLALDLQVSIILCVQLTRDAEGKEPTMADLRDSGSIEQDCNRIFLLHRVNKEYAENCEVDIICPKNRGGASFKAQLMFIGNKTKFEPMEVRRE